MNVGKVVLGTCIGVAGVAAAPFTGGGSVLASATLAGSLGGGATIMAVAAGAGGATIGFVSDKVATNQLLNKIKEAKISSFSDGIKEGVYLSAQEIKKNTDFYFATIALSYYIARCDGSISQEEEQQIETSLKLLAKDTSILTTELHKLSNLKENQELSFSDVASYLDNVDINSLSTLRDGMTNLIEASDGVSKEELVAKEEFEQYFKLRTENAEDEPNLTFQEKIDKSVEMYAELLDSVIENLQKATAMQKQDVALCVVATLLQFVKTEVINFCTQIEKAGSNNRNEKALHGAQNKILSKFTSDSSENTPIDYYAPLEQIITIKGVPYDATGKTKFMKGANHRFTTLGHDPILGLLFGTANILTNTITGLTKENLIPIPCTNYVQYDANFKNPKITQQAETLEMLNHVCTRVTNEPQAVVAAIIKQLIHIGTDLYTKAGIQLPAETLVLDVSNVEKITKYISTGDVLKFQASSELGKLIDNIIATIHRCMFVPSGDEVFDEKLYEVRTRNILLYSNLVATSLNISLVSLNISFSSLVLSCDQKPTNHIQSIDWSGIVKAIYTAFSDKKFIEQLQQDYINQKPSEVYDQKLGTL